MKVGRLSKQEWEFIEKNAERMPADQIAAKLQRNIESVEKHLRKISKSYNKKEVVETQAEYDLKSRPYWKELKAQFSEEELELFLHHWKQIIAQFRKDVLPTEELQIIDVIRLEILINRALRGQQESIARVSELERQLEIERQLPQDEQDQDRLFNLERQIASLSSAREAMGKEFKTLQEKKDGLYKVLKATREQRIEKLESNKQTLSSLVHKILRDPEFYEREGKELEKMRLSMEQEKRRLGDYHTFDDGMVDRPMLTAETVFFEGEDND